MVKKIPPQYKPGQSGNPAGRPKGIIDKRALFRSLLLPHSEEILTKALEKVREGDTTILKIILEHILPAKPMDDPTNELEGIHRLPLDKQVNLVVEKMGGGMLTPKESKTVMDVIDSKAQMTDLKDLKDKVDEIADVVIKDK
jgi:hypothetical protein